LAHSLSLPFLLPYINPSTSQHRHFSPEAEDEESMFLQNISIYWQAYMAQKSRTSSSLLTLFTTLSALCSKGKLHKGSCSGWWRTFRWWTA
jgi:hypothetical protein